MCYQELIEPAREHALPYSFCNGTLVLGGCGLEKLGFSDSLRSTLVQSLNCISLYVGILVTKPGECDR